MNISLEIQENDEGPALGGAILAAVGCGKFENVEAATSQLVKVKEVIKPEADLVAKYEEKYATFKKLYPMVKDLYR